MKNSNILISMFVVVLLIILTGCSEIGENNDEVKNSITLGYCPTMKYLAEDIASKNSYILLQPFDNTAQALNELNEGSIDLAIVGRLAGKNELDDAFEKRLRDGLTFIGKEKKFIYMSQLKNSRIHTAVDKDIVEEYIPDVDNIIFHESTELAIREGMDDIVLIGWKDFKDSYGLIIPVDNEGNKIEKFRIPVIYSYSKEAIENLKI